MTTTDIQRTDTPQAPAVRTAAEIGQATAVEQARAVAEVQGAIVVAQQCPRSTTRAIADMRESCKQTGLAERAFFRYSRAGSQITGPSVHLARELARCWGNMQYGLTELRRDDTLGESEMLAFAWDVQTNTRATTTFIVKHSRDTKEGRKPLIDLRDVYENNANNGARRLREQIFAILPKWYTEEAQEICRDTLENGGDTPLPQRIATLVDSYAKNVGVSVGQLEAKVGRKRDDWTAHDVVALTVIGKSIANGETTVDDEFDTGQVTADEIKQRSAKKTTPAKAAVSAPEKPAGDVELCPGGCGEPAGAHSATACPAVAGSTDVQGALG